MTTRAVIRWGGLSLAGGAVLFLGVFTYLAARFNYPDVLDGPAGTVLPNLLATGTQGRFVRAIYAFLPHDAGVDAVAEHPVLGFIGMFRNVTSAVASVAAPNNYVLPAFMIVLGVAFVRWPMISDSAGVLQSAQVAGRARWGEQEEST